MNCWHIGNTTVRNPYRLITAMKAISKSNFIGNMVGKTRQSDLALFLNKFEVVNISEETISKGTELSSLGRKWHAALHQLGFVTPRLSRSRLNDINTKDYIDETLLRFTSKTNYLSGRPFEITANGERLIKTDNIHFQQECFLRSLAALRNDNFDKTGTFSPLKLTIGILLKLKEKRELPIIKAREMAIIIQQNLDDSNIDDITNKLISFRKDIELIKGRVLKNKFTIEYCKKTIPV